MMIAARNAFLMGGAKLPYDAEVDYLESTGTQWVDSGIVPTIVDATNIVADISLTAIQQSDNSIIFGNFGDQRSGLSSVIRQFSFVDTSSRARVSYGSAYTGSVTIDAGVRHLFSAQFARGNSWLDVDAVRSSSGTGTVSQLPAVGISFFACHYFADSVISPAKMRLYSATVSLNGTLVRAFIPVRIGSGSSAVGYLYDRANPDGGPLGNGLYGNAADGQGGKAGFPASCIGPDK